MNARTNPVTGLEQLSAWLIRQAARHAPPSLSERLEEEWLADLAARRGSVSRLRLALGCSWATRVIAHEFAGSSLAAASAAAGHGVIALAARQDPAFFSRRTVALLLIACLHLGAIYALATGLVGQPPVTPPQHTTAELLPSLRPANQPPPLPDPRMARIPIAIEEPHDLQLPPVEPARPAAGAATPAGPAPKTAPAQVLSRVPGAPGQGFPSTGDYYPPASIRLAEQGSATIRVCVDESGRLTAGPSLLQSSGSARLDQGALKLARAGSGHYRPTTENGRPVSACYPFRVRFELQN